MWSVCVYKNIYVLTSIKQCTRAFELGTIRVENKKHID